MSENGSSGLRLPSASSLRGTRPGSSEITLIYLIKQVEMGIRSHLEQVLRGHGLTVVQYTAMTVLERHPSLTSAQLAKNAFVRAQTMIQVTAQLESLGLISRRPDPANHRRQLLSVTEEGQSRLDVILPAVDSIEEQMLAELTRAEVLRLREALHSCRIALGGERPR